MTQPPNWFLGVLAGMLATVIVANVALSCGMSADAKNSEYQRTFERVCRAAKGYLTYTRDQDQLCTDLDGRIITLP